MILGIDPGTRNIGFAVIRRDGSFVVSGVLDLAEERFDRGMITVFDWFLELVNTHLEAPQWCNTVACEGVYVGGNLRLSARLGEIVGLMHAVAIITGVEFVEIAPAAGRKALTGNGDAADRRALQCAWEHTGNETLTIHEADALGVALAALEIIGKYKEEEHGDKREG